MVSKITQKTLNDLEFNRVLELISEYCVTEPGKKEVLQLRPMPDPEGVLNELDQADEYLSSYSFDNRIPKHYFEDITKELHLLQIEDSFLEGASFLKISSISGTVNELIRFLKKNKEIYPILYHQISKIQYTTDLIQKIDKIISNFGDVKDKASEELYQIRKEINRIRGQIGASFTRALNQYSNSGYLDDIKESVVDNQRVLAVQAMHRKKVKGTILGSSKTGSIVFIAPQSTLQYTREIQNLMYEEQEEIVRILKKLTEEIRPFSDLLLIYQSYLTHLDTVAARAKYALRSHACKPKISKEKQIDLIDAYHPILWEENNKNKLRTVPQSITLNKEQRIIVISGPNAGGKSITLKTIGLLQVMFQSGILIPVNEKSKISFFENVLTDIGDNQSIENHLSTYSYRLKNMRNFLRKCNQNTLFLIDEFGTGSDPELGGALAEIFLEEFYEKGAYGIITTHYANLKVLASELEQMINANMQFDQRSLEPLFKLNTGQAGSSFTFEVAQKNGIPFSLINRAKKKVEKEKIRLDKTIAKLQKERLQLQRKAEKLEQEKSKAEESSSDLLAKQKKIQEKINSFQELYDNNQKMLSYGRKINEFTNRYFQRKNKKELISDFLKWVTVEQTKYEKLKKDKESTKLKIFTPKEEKVPVSNRERKKINREKRILRKQREEERKQKEAELKSAEAEVLKEVEKVRIQKKKQQKRAEFLKTDYQFKIDDRVRLIDGNAKGTIEKIEKNIATINYGIFTAKADLKQLELVQSASGKKR
ncbi:MAG: DNA mismatch repair protein MutS [Flavobacteriia bacterium]|nr:MAG: DNA mismatch repair protein MutS [Flavobacteriia bacterium]